jgi:hypothetical protein
MAAIANQVRRQERILKVESGGPFVDLKAGFALACRKASGTIPAGTPRSTFLSPEWFGE